MPLTPADASGQPRTLVALSVMPDGRTVIPAKSVKVSDGFGGWRLAWVPPVKVATLALSKSGVLVGEQFDIVLSIPGGVPEGGATVRFVGPVLDRTEIAHEAATTVRVPHALDVSGSFTAHVTTMGGTTTFGPVVQTVNARSTVAVTGSAWVMSTECPNPTGLNTIAAAAFTAALSNPAAVARVDWSIHYPSTGWQATRQTDLNPTGNVSMSMKFGTPGGWHVRAIITHKDGTTVESNHHYVEVRKKALTAAVSDANPVVNSTVRLTASCTEGCSYPASASQWFHNGGAGWTPDSGSNPVDWAAWGTISWLWRESFADGSFLHSNSLTVTPVAPAPTEVVTDVDGNGVGHYRGTYGGTGLVNAMRDARAANLPLRIVGAWTLELNSIWIPDGVVVRAHGAVFNHRPVARFRNAARWPAADMPTSCGGYDGGSFHWEGGEFNGGGDGIFTISHSPGFTIRDTTMYNYCTSTEDGHAIEINSSGGNDLGLTEYRVWILNNKFRGVQNGQRPNSNDEPVHYDWAWQGSGCGGAEDHTMCHNVYIGFNEFWSPWEHAKCAIGGHRMSAASYGDMGNAGLKNPADGNPSERHNSFLIERNVIHGAVGATSGVSPDKGSIALFCLRGVHVRDNAFHGCLPGVSGKLVSAFDPTQNLNSAIVGISIYGNTHNGAAVNISMPASGSTGG
jgi:hypothetical protein